MATPSLLGIDLGTSAVKCLLVDLAGRPLAAASAPYPIQRPQPDYAEQAPADWLEAVGHALAAVLAHAPTAQLLGIGLSGQMHGTVLLDGAKKLLAPAIIWPDQRSAAQVAGIYAATGRERFIATTGSPVATGFQAATLCWLRAHRPEIWEQIRHVLLPKDYLRWQLTGELATDPSDGAGSTLLDITQRGWAEELLAALEIDPAWLPPLQPAASVAGHLTSTMAARFGLPPGLPVITGAADTPCSALGAGVLAPGELLLTLSSGGQLLLPIAQPAVDPQGRIHTFCSALEPAEGAAWYQMGAILTAGLALQWLRDRVFNLDDADGYGAMTGWAAQAEPGADGLIFLPYLAGERTPHMNPQARGIFYGLMLHHDRSHLTRAILEGVAFACYDAFQVLQQLGGAPQRIVLAGGGARSPLWSSILADLFDLPVTPLAVVEQSALGAVLLAGAGLQIFDLTTTAQSWARYGQPLLPNRAHHAFYKERFSFFRSLYTRNFTG
jgi:xylulokinase